jgi:hypothetical protein
MIRLRVKGRRWVDGLDGGDPMLPNGEVNMSNSPIRSHYSVTFFGRMQHENFIMTRMRNDDRANPADFTTDRLTFRIGGHSEVRWRPIYYFLDDDCEAVDVTLLCSIDWTTFHAQQLGCRPKHIVVVIMFSNLSVTTC